ncbi:MAG: class I SAM-dependent methyltransferase, partial [Spirochaetaceae bacterium]|nr:class I SAM-dependent methyltransferase [Spirochaetaceae bacterium]
MATAASVPPQKKRFGGYEMENYEEVFKNHDGFVSHKWVHYFYIYDRLFEEYRSKNKPLIVMEIGVDRGGSLEIWKKYLPEGSVIHGVDINPKCKDINFSENIFFHLGSAADHDFMEKTFADTEFDIILDDGSHICSDVIKTFQIMFPKIKQG